MSPAYMYIQAHGSKQSDVGPYYCMVGKAGCVKDNPEFRIMRLTFQRISKESQPQNAELRRL